MSEGQKTRDGSTEPQVPATGTGLGARTTSRHRPTPSTGTTKTGGRSSSTRATRKTSRNGGAGQALRGTLEHELEEQQKYSKSLRPRISHTLREVWDRLSDTSPDTVAWSVEVLEQSLAELELQLDSLKRGNTDDADTEFKLRYEAQKDLNAKLEEQTHWYSQELSKTKERFRQAQQRASYNLTTLCQEYSYDVDLDQYTEAELSVMVRQLERERNISYSEFRNKTWLLDSRSKEYHQLKDLCDAYSGDLNFVNRSLEEMWRKRSASSGGGYGPATASIMRNGEAGFHPSQRVLNPRHGPVRKTAGVRSLPRLDTEGLDSQPNSVSSRQNGENRGTRTRSLDERGRRKRLAAEARQRHKSAIELATMAREELARSTQNLAAQSAMLAQSEADLAFQNVEDLSVRSEQLPASETAPDEAEQGETQEKVTEDSLNDLAEQEAHDLSEQSVHEETETNQIELAAEQVEQDESASLSSAYPLTTD